MICKLHGEVFFSSFLSKRQENKINCQSGKVSRLEVKGSIPSYSTPRLTNCSE